MKGAYEQRPDRFRVQERHAVLAESGVPGDVELCPRVIPRDESSQSNESSAGGVPAFVKIGRVHIVRGADLGALHYSRCGRSTISAHVSIAGRIVHMAHNARVVNWNGKDVPPGLRELPAGRYVVEAVEDKAPALSPEEEAGIEAALESYRQGRVVDAKRAREIIDAALGR